MSNELSSMNQNNTLPLTLLPLLPLLGLGERGVKGSRCSCFQFMRWKQIAHAVICSSLVRVVLSLKGLLVTVFHLGM